ncbi:hypothetical protein HPB47_026071 [Ixodes persulcatus]|uniref:Uncharacterized protein n=1 Tax=Ixodes persulcatus TaxID=34615 RepID=A0AC60Q0Y8_IXOPE|nr:hypothetical protein HPB47_026071 [Ixodes persulcatus]
MVTRTTNLSPPAQRVLGVYDQELRCPSAHLSLRRSSSSPLWFSSSKSGAGQAPQPQKKCSRVERLLRKTLLAAVLGIVLCCLQGYGVAGPHGMFAAAPRAAAVLPWFAYQTLHRWLEFTMACIMASITRKSLYGNCYRQHSCNEKYRGSLFS